MRGNTILMHYACGEMFDYIDPPTGAGVGWVRHSHRGVHLLKNIEFPSKQKRYIFSPQFQIKYDLAFEEVVRECAHPRQGEEPWITSDYIEGLLELHKRGFAHSFESWEGGKLVGGAFGLQLGAMMQVDSMFYRVSHASKAAYGQTLLHLQKRGFQLCDSNPVEDSSLNYGEQWIPQWQFESMLPTLISQTPTLTDDSPRPVLPASIRQRARFDRVFRAVKRRFGIASHSHPSATGASHAPSRQSDKSAAQ